MHLNPDLITLLEADEPERLIGVLVWLHADSQTIPSHYARLNAVLDEVQTMSATACYQALNAPFALDDMIRTAILNEFGPPFEQKPLYLWLTQALRRRLAQAQPTH